MPRGVYLRPSLEDRFWPKVEKTEKCWIWKAAISGSGYGNFSVGGKIFSAHRIAWELTYGSIPKEIFVLHSCDVQNCVRPDHLFLGTSKDNTQDMILKGRGNWSRPPRGEEHCRAKLTEENVFEIRELEGKLLQKEIAEIYGVSRRNIGDICRRKTWKHV